MSGRIFVLGPQHPEPNLPAALDYAGVKGPVAVISAGWRHDEAQLEPLARASGRQLVHLPLYRWFDEVSKRLPELASEWHEQQSQVRALKQAYATQLRGVAYVLDELERRPARSSSIQAQEVAFAHDGIRTLDQRVLRRLDEVRAGFPQCARPWELPEVAALHEQAREKLAHCQSLLIAGGHVAVLLNRMRFFGLDDLAREHHQRGGSIFAWSGGAMVLTERIVLFYDDPPDGSGDPEVLDRGIGLVQGTIVFPHASERLRLHDRARIQRLASRMYPYRCLTLDNGANIEVRGSSIIEHGTVGSALDLLPDGTVRPPHARVALPGAEPPAEAP